MSNFEDARAAYLAQNDQEWAKASEWVRRMLKQQPDLLFAIGRYLNRSVDETGTELTPDMLKTIKLIARLGWGLLMHELGEKGPAT